MKNLCAAACGFLSSPTRVLCGIIFVSVLALGTALIAEHGFGLKPCIFCVYQRIPFVIAIVFGVLGLALKRNANAARGLIGLSGLAFLANAGIAFYHTGIERKWWRSPFESCAADFGDGAADPQSLLESIMSAPVARCDEISWSDPVLGLTMANLNVVLCAGLFALCVLALLRQCPKGSSSP